jgi:hypothetical protein
MLKLLYLGVFFFATLAAAQTAPSPPPPESPKPAGIEGLTPDTELRGKTSLVRGVLKRFDAIHDELLVQPFGGGNVRIAFDTRTEMLQGDTQSQVTGIPVGSVVSIDTVIDRGKLFARSVRIAAPAGGDLSGQVVRYDASKGRLLVRDAGSPDNIVLHVTSATVVVNRDQHVSLETLSPGMLVRIKFSPGQNAATNIEILAEKGNTFSFAGKVLAVDLRARTVALANASDQSLHELAINSLDPASLRLLREGAEVSIQADFDGDRYNARSVTLVPQTP